MPRLTKAAQAKALGGPTEDYHPTVVDEFTDADGEQMVELADGNIEAASEWLVGNFDQPVPADHHEHVHTRLDDADDFVPDRPALPHIDPKAEPLRYVAGTKHLFVTGMCQGEARITGKLAEQMSDGAAERMHAKCPGALVNGNGTVVLCGCPGHEGENRCCVCGHVNAPETFDSQHRRCTDVEACADRLFEAAIASSRTPTSRMIREVKAASRRMDPASPSVAAPRATSGRRTGRPCQDGCGLITGGGLFRPGHDAKLKSVLQKAAKDGDVAASVELLARSWPSPEVPLGSVEQEHLASEQAKQDYIAQRVAARYENVPIEETQSE